MGNLAEGFSELHSRTIRILLTGILASSFLVSCSEDKSPPDDGKSGKIAMASKTTCSNESSLKFQACALEILDRSGLAAADRDALSGCGFSGASPVASSEDLFEVARATIKAHCL